YTHPPHTTTPSSSYLLLYIHTLLISLYILIFFFFNHTATTEIYTLSLHDALPICPKPGRNRLEKLEWIHKQAIVCLCETSRDSKDRKSTRLNSSHRTISYAVFCLKKKKKKKKKNKQKEEIKKTENNSLQE